MQLTTRITLSTLLTAGLAYFPGTALAQAPNIAVQGRLQVQYRASGGDSTTNYNPTLQRNGFEIRRARIQANVRFGDNITFVVQPSFEMSALRLRDAYLRVGLNPHWGITLGQEKSPFQRYELVSSNNLLSIERGLRVLALSGKEAMNDVLLNNGYVSHDMGAFVDYVAPESRFTVKVGLQNGSRESSLDVNNAKSFFGRVTGTPVINADNQPVLQLGASIASRDRAVCNSCAGTITYFPGVSKRTNAFGADLEYGGFRPGLHIIADVATGDNVPIARRINTGRNTGNLINTADSNVVTFRSIHLIGAYRVNTSGSDNRLVKTLEPALRLDLTDPNTSVNDDAGILITPVLNVYFTNTVILRAALDVYRYKTLAVNRYAQEFKISWQANF